MTGLRLCAYLWASPCTALGSLAIIASGATWRWRDGVIEAAGPGVARLFDAGQPAQPIAAMTLGHVVIARDETALESTRAHERVHVDQYEWLGPLFLPAYACASLVAWARRGDAYLDNAFERQARRRTAGRHPRRSA